MNRRINIQNLITKSTQTNHKKKKTNKTYTNRKQNNIITVIANIKLPPNNNITKGMGLAKLDVVLVLISLSNSILYLKPINCTFLLLCAMQCIHTGLQLVTFSSLTNWILLHFFGTDPQFM